MEAAKKEPRRIRIAGAQTGGTDHLATALLEKAGGVKFTYVPFDGGGAAFAAFLGGNVEATFGTLEEGLEQIKAQKARPLAILSEKRRPEDSYKDVPTAKELGYDVVFGQNWSVALPPGASPELAVWWEDKFRKVVNTKAWQDGLKAKFQRSEFYGLDRVKEYLVQAAGDLPDADDGAGARQEVAGPADSDEDERRSSGARAPRAVGHRRARDLAPRLLG